MKGKTISYYIIFIIVTLVASTILSIILANILYLVYSPTPQDILYLNPQIMIGRLFENEAVNQMFWIIILCFGILIITTKFNKWFRLKRL